MSAGVIVDRREPPAGRRRVGEWFLEPESAVWARGLAQALPSPLHTLGIAHARDLEVGGSDPSPSLYRVQDTAVPTTRGPIPVRVYAPGPGADLPLVLQMHGGGWALGGLAGGDEMCRRLCRDSDCVVVAIDYPLAPEHTFPDAVEACFEVLTWAVSGSAELGIDPRRVAVLGDSAGGNLAAAIAILARDRGGPSLLAQVLVYPVTRRMRADEVTAVRASPLLTRDDVDWFWSVYGAPLGSTDARAFPVSASLVGLPPALMVLAEVDPLREQGVEYAEALSAAGVPAAIVQYGGVFHGFFPRPSISPSAVDAIGRVAEFLRESLSAGTWRETSR